MLPEPACEGAAELLEPEHQVASDHYANQLECISAQAAVEEDKPVGDVAALEGVRGEPAGTEATLEETGEGVGMLTFIVTKVNLLGIIPSLLVTQDETTQDKRATINITSTSTSTRTSTSTSTSTSVTSIAYSINPSKSNENKRCVSLQRFRF